MTQVTQKLSKALFLDRDGTIIEQFPAGTNKTDTHYGYITEVEQVSLIEGSADAISKAKHLGYKTIIATNQSAIARGWLTEEKLGFINSRMFSLLKEQNPGAVIDELIFCPYYKDGVIEKYSVDSPCRKPQTAMITEAQAKHNIDLAGSYLIGDSYTDIKCGLNAGTKAILVLTGYGKTAYKKCLDERLKINFIADNLLEAVKYIEENDA